MDAEYQIKEKLLSLFGACIAAYFPTNPINHEAIWVDAVFENLRMSVASGSTGAIEIASLFIEQDPTGLPFSKLIKSNLARALKKHASQISPTSRAKIIAATVRLLQADHLPRELEDYAKLIKKFPNSEYVRLVSAVVPVCEKARTIQRYLNTHP